MYRFLTLFILVTLPLTLSARDSLSVAQQKTLEKTVNRMILLSNIIQWKTRTLATEKLFLERKKLSTELQKLTPYLTLYTLRKPTTDISKEYKLTLQKYKLSCEIAALRMLIGREMWRYPSEEDIIEHIPHYTWTLEWWYWWDPEREFVGSYTGSQRWLTGYGVYEKPLRDYAERYPLTTSLSNSTTDPDSLPRERLSRVISLLDSGSSVMLWWDWCTSSDDEDGIVEKIDSYIIRSFSIAARNTCDRSSDDRIMRWRLSTGESITWLSWEHAFVLLGYIGPSEKPTHIIVWDTDTGKHVYRTSEWIRKWSLMDYRMLAIDRKK